MAVDFKKYPLSSKVRHHISSFNYLPADTLKYIPSTYPPVIEKLNWDEIFDNSKPPDILDIGCGRGFFLIRNAEKNPKKNYLGIEVRGQLVEWINDVIKNEKIHNCHALRYSVVNGLKFIGEQSIESIFYLFPDPWPKQKQQKRRAFNIDFLNNCYNALKEGGRLHLATDCDYVHEYHMKILNKFEKFLFSEVSKSEWDFPMTNQEEFCQRKNISVFRLIAIK